MIRCIAGSELPPERDTECSARIHSLRNAYGNTDLVRFYTDEAGVSLALLDGVATLDMAENPTEEWQAFIRLLPDLRILHTAGTAEKWLSAIENMDCTSGKLMRFTGKIPPQNTIEASYKLEDLYSLLQSGFTALPPFDSWYVDVSHRVRHNTCHLAVVVRDGVPVSMAMTVAETQQAAVIGAVVTAPSYRRQGLASRCITNLLAQLADKRTVWIAPVDTIAEQLYARLGFTICESQKWAELIL